MTVQAGLSQTYSETQLLHGFLIHSKAQIYFGKSLLYAVALYTHCPTHCHFIISMIAEKPLLKAHTCVNFKGSESIKYIFIDLLSAFLLHIHKNLFYVDVRKMLKNRLV